MFRKLVAGALLAGTAPIWLALAQAHSIKAEPAEAVKASFDIIETTIVGPEQELLEIIRWT